MGGLQVEQVSEVKLVGFLFDSKLTFSSMIDKLARKARTRVAALRRLKPMLDNENLKLMYTMSVRSILEYGSIVYMDAADTHLDKLERVQNSAMSIGGFTVESLRSRREAAAISLAFDMLDGSCHVELQDHAPEVHEPLRLTKKRTRHSVAAGIQIKDMTKTNSLDSHKRSYLGQVHKIWAKLPQTLLREGQDTSWKRIKARAKKFLMGKWAPSPDDHDISKEKKVKRTQQVGRTNHSVNWNAIHKSLKDMGISITNTGYTSHQVKK